MIDRTWPKNRVATSVAGVPIGGTLFDPDPVRDHPVGVTVVDAHQSAPVVRHESGFTTSEDQISHGHQQRSQTTKQVCAHTKWR